MKHFNTFMIAVSAFFFASCGTVLPAYTPNVPFLKEKGEAHFTANGVLGGTTSGANIQAAYSPSSNFYISSNAFWLQQANTSAQSSFYEVGLGYYGKKGGALVYEFSAGGGFGANKYSGKYKEDLGRFYFQGAIGHATSNFEIGGGMKMCYTAIRSNGTTLAGNPDRDSMDIWITDFSPNVWTAEPFFLMRIGGPKFKFNTSFSYPFILGTYEVFPDPLLTLGVSFRIGR